MAIGICQYCGEEKELCSAHIIPKAFYKLKQSPYLGISSDGKVDVTKCQNGIKDPNILCAKCDGILGKYDKYAVEILKKKILENPKIPWGMSKDAQLNILTDGQFDYHLLRMFFVSLVWRASVSNLPETKDISLGKYQDIALKILKGEIPDNPYLFHPIIIRMNEKNEFSNIAGIMKGKYAGQWKTVFAIPDYQIGIITNAEPLKNSWIIKSVSLNPYEFAVIETGIDINGIQIRLQNLVDIVKKVHGGILPDIGKKSF